MDLFSFSDPAWTRVDDTARIFSQVDPVDGVLVLGEHVSLAVRSLPMYEDVRLYSLTSGQWEPGLRICYLERAGSLLRLSGTSSPIHELNSAAPIRISDANVLYYLSFFCFFVRGAEGPFYILHDMEDELLPRGFADITMRGEPGARSPRQLFRCPRLFGRENEKWRVSALVHYSNAVFHGDFLVHPGGMVEMLDDVPLLADLPCRIVAPLGTPARRN